MPPGSLLTSRGEDSEEDENTEYFDAMEDSASFITVTTEPSEDRWARRRRLLLCASGSLRSGFSFQSCSRCWSCLG